MSAKTGFAFTLITQLADELGNYFGLSRDQETVAIILKAIVKTDMERGMFLQNLTGR